jgi:uncharacterized protein YndB with AHSA1/START domain
MQQIIAAERTIWIDAPCERVWVAITEQTGQWWTPNQWKIPVLAVGGAIIFGEEPDACLAVIEVVDPPREFTIRWKSTPPQVTTIILEAENDGTRVIASQSGFEALYDDIRQQQVDRTSEGYAIILNNLKTLLESV